MLESGEGKEADEGVKVGAWCIFRHKPSDFDRSSDSGSDDDEDNDGDGNCEYMYLGTGTCRSTGAGASRRVALHVASLHSTVHVARFTQCAAHCQHLGS